MKNNKPLVLIVVGSYSDLPIMKETSKALDELDLSYKLTISSAHRSPKRTQEIAHTANQKGFKVIIAGAGGAAHLAGAIAAETILPVIGVPIDSSSLNGLDALLSTVQMPSGVPVSTMAIGKAGARNAGILASQILALTDSEMASKLHQAKTNLALGVEEKDKELKTKGG